MLDDLSQKILNVILHREEPIPGQTLAAVCGASVNTIRKEINQINERLMPHGVMLQAQMSQGFELVWLRDDPETEQYVERLRILCRRNSLLSAGSSQIINSMVRELLSAGSSLTSAHLQEKYFLSYSTLMRELNQVRRVIAPFGLELRSSRKDGGFYIGGNEWDIRQCLIYQHKIWTLSLYQSDIKEYEFWSQFMMLDGQEWQEKIRSLLVARLRSQTDFMIPYMYIPKLTHYVQLASSRYRHASELHFTEEQCERVMKTPEYWFAKDFMSELPGRLRYSAQDVVGFAMLILSYETQNFGLQEWEGYERLEKELSQLTEYLDQYWAYGDYFDQVAKNDWLCHLYAMENRRLFHVYMDQEHLAIMRGKGVQSTDLCVSFSRFYSEVEGVSLSRDEAMSPCYLFHGMRHRAGPIKTYRPNILVMSRYGIAYSRSLSYKLRSLYRRRVGKIVAREYLGGDEEDFLTYDLLITDITSKRLETIMSFAIPTIYLDFSRNISSYARLDQFLEKWERDQKERLLPRDRVFYEDLSEGDEVIDFIVKHGVPEGWDENQVAEELRKNRQAMNLERDNGIVFLPLFARQILTQQITVLINRRPIRWEEQECRIFICYCRMPSPEDNSILNELLKCFLYLEPEQQKQLCQGETVCSTEELWNLLSASGVVPSDFVRIDNPSAE